MSTTSRPDSPSWVLTRVPGLHPCEPRNRSTRDMEIILSGVSEKDAEEYALANRHELNYQEIYWWVECSNPTIEILTQLRNNSAGMQTVRT